ncbi:Ethanolamine kinase 2 [Plecturocebus cupreus]
MEEKAAASAGGRELPGPPRAAAVAYFGISVDPDYILPGALRLIQELRPHWKPEQVRTKVVERARGRGWGPAGAATRMRDPVLASFRGVGPRGVRLLRKKGLERGLCTDLFRP